ncbi:MAG: hypothetical protein HYV33_03040 [Candidatus Kerfeldbacteria bacterium]|nr:hypothetical protein [Candidatus Kerfeldbacteria bacterium]
MSLFLLGRIIQTVGEVMVGYTALRVHHRVWQEHKIDKAVFREMKQEQVLGMLGLLAIVSGLVLEIITAS